MKKSFKVLSLFTLICLGCYIVVLYFSNDSSLSNKHVAREGYDKLSQIIGERLNRMWAKDKEEKEKEKEKEKQQHEGQEEAKPPQEPEQEVKQEKEKPEEQNNEQKEPKETLTEQTEKQEEPKEKEQKTKKTVNKPTLPPCPDVPPSLVGPIAVDFSVPRVLEEMGKYVSDAVKEGGRYKPEHCSPRQKVAIVIPFRHREQHLAHWLYYLHPILMRQQIDYGVYVIHQAGEGIFNRAKLMNVGYMEALKEYDYNCFVFSDVDLVPLDDRNLYRCYDEPRHLAVAMDKFNFRLPYNTYFGGVSSLSKEQFLKINGFSNTYWGWGGEDDDIYKRIIFKKLSISRPNMMIGKYKMVRHNRDPHNESNPKNPDKLRQTLWTMDQDGISNLEYLVMNTVKERLYTMITVNIKAPTG
ncbi:beta-1,4-galactosyltransferase 2-like [Synchiropus splendidus]|uniref:beta-1,4-galactosyltransferase 2-like n=1 Tax=Synchiropus splendidus TaxID=270530 RepID=UPI00237DD222|nr:beta-1,4-galactosyltransferase 2-like [Synchiropus splendidus]